MNFKDEFIELHRLVSVNNDAYPVKPTIKMYRKENDRLWSLVIGMMVGSKYTGKQITKLVKSLQSIK